MICVSSKRSFSRQNFFHSRNSIFLRLNDARFVHHLLTKFHWNEILMQDYASWKYLLRLIRFTPKRTLKNLQHVSLIKLKILKVQKEISASFLPELQAPLRFHLTKLPNELLEVILSKVSKRLTKTRHVLSVSSLSFKETFLHTFVGWLMNRPKMYQLKRKY